MQPLTESDPVRIGNYRLTGRLGAGGMGTVYFGQTPGGRPVAVKVVSGRFAHDELALERFRREVETLRTVRSAYTASLIDCGLDAPPYWFATEYVPGRTLESAVRASGRLPVQLCLGLMAALAEGLSDIHVRGILHRDVKPQNIILSPVGPQLIDFGIARENGQPALTQVGFTAGSAGFTSPEALKGEDVGPAADVFALGAALAFAATGRSPYGDGTFAAVAYRTVHGDIDLDGVDAPLAAVIASCTAQDPARRPTPKEIVELCQSHTSLANDPAYQRIAAQGGDAGSAHPDFVPTAVDAAGAAPTVPAAVSPAPGEAQPTRILPAASPTVPDTPQPPADSLEAGPAASAPPPGAPGRLRSRRGVAVAAASAVAVGAAAALLLATQHTHHDTTAPPERTHTTTAEPEGTGTAGRTTQAGEPDDGATASGEGASSPSAPPEERLIDSPTTLRPGDEVVTVKIRLVMQHDGNLVAYDENNQARWASQTAGTGARTDFQPDGNLVVYDAGDNPVWASNTSGHTSAVLRLQSDGNVVIADGDTALWAAGTQH